MRVNTRYSKLSVKGASSKRSSRKTKTCQNRRSMLELYSCFIFLTSERTLGQICMEPPQAIDLFADFGEGLGHPLFQNVSLIEFMYLVSEFIFDRLYVPNCFRVWWCGASCPRMSGWHIRDNFQSVSLIEFMYLVSEYIFDGFHVPNCFRMYLW